MKQNDIEEMETAIIGAAHGNIQIIDRAKAIAIGLYNAGYRIEKQSVFAWISDDDIMCGACGKVHYTADNADAATYKYCPNCGARVQELCGNGGIYGVQR